MKIYLASDHGGYFYKEEIQKYLEKKGHDVVDIGNREYEEGDDYPDFVIPLAEKVAKDKKSYGVILGRSGNGEVIAANKVKGVRAILGLTVKLAKIAREHNDANVLSLGADHMTLEGAIDAVEVFLNTSFSNAERHVRRLEEIRKYETKNALKVL